MRKLPFVCPHCGAPDASISEEEYNEDFTLMTNVCECDRCYERWTEYFVIAYDGYSSSKGEYTVNGRCIKASKNSNS